MPLCRGSGVASQARAPRPSPVADPLLVTVVQTDDDLLEIPARVGLAEVLRKKRAGGS